jgi:hypothetical protein
MSPITITEVVARDVRFPTSENLDGSDAMNPAPDYSAAYAVLKTDSPDGLEGHGLTFTIGAGNELCVAAIDALAPLVVGKTLESFAEDMGAFWHHVAGDSQLRWVGPEKGVIHLATAAVVNAVWDLYAKSEGKPLWKLLADMSPEELVRCVPFRYITDAITPEEALRILRENEGTKAEREAEMLGKASRPTRRARAGSATRTRRSGVSAAKRSRPDGRTSRSRSEPTSRTTRAAPGSCARRSARTASSCWTRTRSGTWARPSPTWGASSSSTRGGSRSPRAPTTCSATPPWPAPSLPSAWRPASTA